MKRILLFLLLCLCGCRENSQEEDLLMAIGIEDNVLSEYNDTLLVNAGTMLHGKRVMVDNISYSVAYKNGKPVYVETRDINFNTIEGLSINSTVADCLMLGIKIEAEPGVGLFMRLKKGWRVYLSEGEGFLCLSDKIKYFCVISDSLSFSIDLKSWIDYISASEEIEFEKYNRGGKVFFVPDSQ